MKQIKLPYFFPLLLLMMASFGLQAQNYEATLTGNQQVGPVKTVASGSVDISLNGNTLTVNGSFKNLSSPVNTAIAGGAHLHDTIAGANAGVLIPIPPTSLNEDSTGGTFNINKTLNAALASELASKLQSRQIYVNIHSQKYSAGELRGQVVPEADQLFYADLKGDNHNPAVNTNASGGVIAELNGNQLTVSGSFSNLESDYDESIGSHLHFGDRDRNGNIAIDLNPTLESNQRNGKFEADSNRFTLTNDQLDSLNVNHMYVNIHTNDNPGGAIRGQLNSQDIQTFETKLSGVTQVPAVTSTGVGEVTYKVIGERLLLRGEFNNLTSPVDESIAGGAHIHAGRAGENGSIQIPLDVDLEGNGRQGEFEEDSNEYVINSAIKTQMQNSALYLNIHTNRYPAGEIRGQVTPENDELYVAEISGTSQPMPVRSTGEGNLIVEQRDDSIFVSGTFDTLSSAYKAVANGTGAHLHVGIYGRNGGIQKNLTPQLDNDSLGGTFLRSENRFALSPNNEDNLEQGRFYVNIHTKANPGGEIRGQVIEKPAAIFQTNLSSIQQVQPVETKGIGAALVALYEGSKIALTGSFKNLDSALATSVAGGAHIHKANVGKNGGVQIPIDAETDNTNRSGKFPIDSNRYTLNSTQETALLNSNLYINVHSQKYPSGEIRGQLLNAGNRFPDSTKIQTPADGALVTVSSGSNQSLTIQWNGASDPDGNKTVYIWQLAATNNFTNPLVNINVGTDATLDLSYSTIDSVLAANGIATGGDTLKAFHRVVTSDGSVVTPGGFREASFKRATVGLNDEATANQISLKAFPNPATDQARIQYQVAQSSDVALKVYNTNGQTVHKADLGQINKNQEQQYKLDVSNWEPGMYLYSLEVETDSGTTLNYGKLNVVH